MTERKKAESRQPAPSVLEWIDSVADEFEKQWTTDSRPAIADFLGDTDGQRREALLTELVRIDLAYRRKAGEEATIDGYLEEFPELNTPESTTKYSLILYGRQLEADSVDRRNPDRRPSPDSELLSKGNAETRKPETTPRILGKFELLELIGEGAFGRVYRAKDVELGRMVAIKVPRSGHVHSAEDKERFLREARSAARLKHPGIVQVLDVAHEGEMPYIVSDLIDGQTLEELASLRQLAHRETVELIVRVADALDFAHRDGVIHRDVKPTNILLDSAGRPHLTDFGLAKSTAAGISMTMEGQILGTPAYMSPEQAKGDSSAVDGRCDVYSLGVILYELLTGERPFQGNARMLLLQVLNDPPRPPRRLNDAIPRDLETICLKAMAKSPAGRYERAGEMADDLRRFLKGQPILARPIGPAARSWRWCLRNRLVASLVTGVALAMMIGTAVSLHFAIEARRSAADARKLQRRAERQRLIRELQLFRMAVHTSGWKKTARDMIAQAAEIEVDEELRNHAVPILKGLEATFERYFGVPYYSGGTSVSFDPQGRRLVIGGLHDRARIWNIAADTVAPSDDVNAWHAAVGAAPAMAAGGGDGRTGPVAFRPDGTPVELIRVQSSHPGESSSAVLELRTVPGQKSIRQFSINGTPPPQFNDPKNQYHQYQWALNRDATVTAASVRFADGTTRVWVWKVDADSDAPLHILTLARNDGLEHSSDVQKPDGRLAFSHDGSLVAAADARGAITVWSVGAGKTVYQTPAAGIAIQCLAFHRLPGTMTHKAKEATPGGNWMLAAGDSGGKVTIWDLKRKAKKSICHGTSVAVYALAFNPDGTILASAGRNGIHFWNVTTGRRIFEIGNPPLYLTVMFDYVFGLAFSPDGKRLAVSAIPVSEQFKAAHLYVWKLQYGDSIRTLRGFSGRVWKVVFSAKGNRVAAFSNNWQVGIWDCDTGMLVRLLKVPEGYYPDNVGLALDADGKRCVFSAGTRARMWNLDTGEVKRFPELPPGMGDNLAFDETGRLILVRFETKNRIAQPFSQTYEQRRRNPFICRVRNLLGSNALDVLEIDRPFMNIRRIEISSDGRQFAVMEQTRRLPESDKRVVVFDAKTGTELWRVKSGAADLDSTGRYLIIGEADGIRMYRFADQRVMIEKCAGGHHGPPGGLAVIAEYRPPGKKKTPPQYRKGHTLLRQENNEPLFVVGIDDAEPFFLGGFRPDGCVYAWADGNGTLYLCDVQKTLKQLERLGLQPPKWQPKPAKEPHVEIRDPSKGERKRRRQKGPESRVQSESLLTLDSGLSTQFISAASSQCSYNSSSRSRVSSNACIVSLTRCPLR